MKVRALRTGLASFAVVVALTGSAVASRGAEVPNIPGERELVVLRNGTRVLLCRDTTSSMVDLAVWYDAGIRREPLERAGLAAVCQRLMFAGSPRFPAGEHLRRVGAMGGDVGALVAGDYACYFQTVPESGLEIVMQLEADRMGTVPIDAAHLELARQALRIERRQPAAAAPLALGLRALYGSAFLQHPYRHPVLADDAAVAALTVKEVQEWYRTHYAPRRALITIVGRFDRARALALAHQYFEPLRSSAGAEPKAPAPDPEPNAERRSRQSINVPFHVVLLGWRGPGAGDPDLAPLLVISQVLSGRDQGRLEHGLKARLASVFMTGGDFEVRKDASMLFCAIGIDQAGDSARAEHELVAEVERIGRDGVNADELDRAKRSIESRLVFDWLPVRTRALALAGSEFFNGDAALVARDLERVLEVTTADVQRASDRWLHGRRRNVAWLYPAAPSSRPSAPRGGQ
ncbi:MAG: insulinase family protein [Candidatus Eisenbacteria bacterium]|uniref:Insulinase family protein n=1 Tax=Eiseniibacteriota bacterium TaxID=2212470 RepID=A0A849STR9_UNCEI|nr:insulinase family protein [Candidatus Eisenbacteria bacterium]